MEEDPSPPATGVTAMAVSTVGPMPGTVWGFAELRTPEGQCAWQSRQTSGAADGRFVWDAEDTTRDNDTDTCEQEADSQNPEPRSGCSDRDKVKMRHRMTGRTVEMKEEWFYDKSKNETYS